MLWTPRRNTTLVVRRVKPMLGCYAGASPLAGDAPPAGADEATTARKQACGPDGGRTDDDGERTSAGGARQEGGEEPNDGPEALAGRGRRQGVEGSAASPASPM